MWRSRPRSCPRPRGDVGDPEGKQVAIGIDPHPGLLGVAARDEQALGGGHHGQGDGRRHQGEPGHPIKHRPRQGRRAGIHGSEDGDVFSQPGRCHESCGGHEHDQRPGHSARDTAADEEHHDREDGDAHGSERDLVESAHESDDLSDDVRTGIDVDAEHLRDLRHHDVQRQTPDESDEDRFREKVREKSESEDGCHQEEHSRQDRLCHRHCEVVVAARECEPADRRGDEGSGGGIRRGDQLT